MRVRETLAKFLMKTALTEEEQRSVLSELPSFVIGLSGGDSASGEVVNSKTAMGISAVFACIGLISETIGQLPVRVRKLRKDGRGTDPANEHPLYRLLAERPNEWQTSQEFREQITQHLCLSGNGYALIGRDSHGVPRELLPLQSSWVTVEQDEDWNVTYRVTIGNSYKLLTQHDVFHIKYRTLNGYSGISPIGWQRDTVGSTLSALKYGARYFKNSARPGGIIEIPGNLSEDAYNKLKESWSNNYSGDNAFRTAILQNGMVFKPVTMSNEDAQYIQNRQFGVEEIARIYRVPLHMIQSTEKTTSWGSGIEQMGIGFVQTCLLPWIKRWENSISKFLLPDNERKRIYAKLSVDGLMRGDMEARYASYSKAIMSGFMSPNEVRLLEDLNARDGGDEFFMPLNMQGSMSPKKESGSSGNS